MITKTVNWLKANWMTILKFIVVCGLVIFVVMNYEQLRHIDLKSIVDRAPSVWIAIALVWAVFLLKSFVLVIPASILYLSIGLLFEPKVAVFCSITGMMLEIASTYWFGRFLSGPAVERILKINPTVGELLSSYTKKGAIGIVLVRLSPAPIDLVSLILGNTKYPFWQYYGLSLLGLVPYITLFTIMGSAAYLLPEAVNMTTIYIGAGIFGLGVLIWLILKSRKDVKNNANKSADSAALKQE